MPDICCYYYCELMYASVLFVLEKQFPFIAFQSPLFPPVLADIVGYLKTDIVLAVYSTGEERISFITCQCS